MFVTLPNLRYSVVGTEVEHIVSWCSHVLV